MMLFLASLVAMVALGATVLMDGEDDEFAAPLEDEELPEGEEQITDIGDLISAAEAEEAFDDSDAEGAGTQHQTEADQSGKDEVAVEEDNAAEGREDTGTDDDWTIIGGADDSETLTGTDGSDFLNGYGGDDDIVGGGRDDLVEGGKGDDTLAGGGGDDTLHAEDGGDLLYGDLGADALFGHGGDDTLYGGAGDDSLVGGLGDDLLEGGAGDDAIHGYHGKDVLNGGAGEDTLFGGLGNDVIDGMTGERGEVIETDYLNGGDGDDSIMAGSNDIVTAGEGADVVTLGNWISEGQGAKILDFEKGNDSLVMLYDAANGEPDVGVEQDAEDEKLYRVLADGVAIAEVHSEAGLTIEDIAFVAQAR